MTFIPLGSFTMGTGDQDVPYANVHHPKTISVAAFYMDETEITNNEYRQFVYWVRDSLAHTILGNAGSDYGEHFVSDKQGQPIQYGTTQTYYKINWKQKIDWEGKRLKQGEPNPLDEMYLPEEERFFRRKEIDTRKLFTVIIGSISPNLPGPKIAIFSIATSKGKLLMKEEPIRRI